VSAFTFTLREKPPQRCDLSGLTPERIAGSPADVGRIEIQTTRERLCVGDVFALAPGDPADLRFEGGSERLDNLGAGLGGGRIVVSGDVGQQVGRGMSGGTIVVSGNAGRLAGSGMSGGRIEIGGNAGDLAGGPLPGEMAGMRGGVIRIRGNVGERAGDRMRRGLLVIEGRAGANAASRMIGGTLVVFGEAGVRPGYLMNRGTVILGGGAAEVTPTFVDTGVHELVAMRLIAKWLIDEGIEGGSLTAARLRRLVGDTAAVGKGELFVPA
jgi:formylmethanofuran dehydrogenase subunit C